MAEESSTHFIHEKIEADLTSKKVTNIVEIPVIASGGIGKKEHFYEGVVKGGANALLAASVFHFNEFSINEVKQYLLSKNIKVRV